MVKLTPAVPQPSSRPRLPWLDAIRFFAAVMILLYHAQLLFTQYYFSPQPTGLVNNLRQLFFANGLPDPPTVWLYRLGVPALFGFQFVDVFVLLSGFSLMLSQPGQPIQLTSFWQRRLLRLLWPFWTVVILSYPLLWVFGEATQSYVPNLWSFFAAATFPLLFDYRGTLLLPISGPWWFIPLIISFTVIFPFLHWLLDRWGARHLLWVSVGVTLIYRGLATYQFGGHPTYVILDTPTAELPFQFFLSKLSTFVFGMGVAQTYLQGQGVLFWSPRRGLIVGLGLYGLGFVTQFYKIGWVVTDMLTPLGLTLLCVVAFRGLTEWFSAPQLITRLGQHSYSFFLIHNFIVDRSLKLLIHQNALLYVGLLLPMILTTLFLAILADNLQPLLQRAMVRLWQDLDYVLAKPMPPRSTAWMPTVGETVSYQGNSQWQIVQLEEIVDEGTNYLCKITDQHRIVWVTQSQLKPSVKMS